MATVVTSKFTPFTFEELLKPALMATQAHYEMEDAYTELATKANEWESLANEQTSPEAYKRYKTYSDDLKAQADMLAYRGLTPTSRKALSQMKARYNSEITPIKKAYEALQETNAYRDKIKLSNPGAIFTVPKYTSLDYFLNGNIADNSYINEKDVLSRVASKAQIEGAKMFNMLLNEGKTPDIAIKELWNYMRNPDNPIIKEELKAFGIDKYSVEDQKRILNAMNTGMYNAASDIVEGEYLTRKEREALKLQKNSAERANKQYDLQIAKFNLDMAESGYKYDESKKQYVPDETSPVWAKDKNGNLIKDASGNYRRKIEKDSSTSSKTTRLPRLSTPISVDYEGNATSLTSSDTDIKNINGKVISNLNDIKNDKIKNTVKNTIGEDLIGNYTIIVEENKNFRGNDRSKVLIIPKKSTINNYSSDEDAIIESLKNE